MSSPHPAALIAWQPQHRAENVYSGLLLLTLTITDNCLQIMEKKQWCENQFQRYAIVFRLLEFAVTEGDF